jgi:hypothetical protein
VPAAQLPSSFRPTSNRSGASFSFSEAVGRATYLQTVSARLTALEKAKDDVMRPSDNAADLCRMASNWTAEATLAGV